MSDYQTIRDRAGLIPGATGLVWVDGDDAIVFLDGLVSQNVAAMSHGTAARSLLLAPNGKLRAHLWLLRDEDRVGLVCDADRVDTVVGDLSRFKIRVDVTISHERRPVWDIWGPDAAGGGPADHSAWSDDGTTLVANLPFRHSDLPRRVVAGVQPAVPLVAAVAVEAVRLEVGEPVVGVDLDERTIPQEGGDVSPAVDFTKGCYLGQELVARIDSRGHVNRRLAGFIFEGEAMPERGDDIIHDGVKAGVVTSIGLSGALGTAIGLGMLRVEVEDGAAITASGLPGRVASLPIHP
jgi:folate-binding protein YgfZ